MRMSHPHSLSCPNPDCSNLFDTELDVCNHLSELDSPCSQWTAALVHDLFNQITTSEDEQLVHDVENEEFGMCPFCTL